MKRFTLKTPAARPPRQDPHQPVCGHRAGQRHLSGRGAELYLTKYRRL